MSLDATDVVFSGRLLGSVGVRVPDEEGRREDVEGRKVLPSGVKRGFRSWGGRARVEGEMGVGGGGAGVEEDGGVVDGDGEEEREWWASGSDCSSASSSQESAGSVLRGLDDGRLEESLEMWSFEREVWRALADVWAMLSWIRLRAQG